MQNNTFSTLFVGRNIVNLARVDSTNNYLKDQLTKSEPLPEGTVILAEEQFAGRGQTSNIWVSQPGKNLTFSLLLNPTFISPEFQFALNKLISIAINDCLVKIIGEGVKIKWPNDIYFKDKKLGGVLIENIIRGSKLMHSIIGIGINVNQIDFPENLTNVTSLSKILHQDYDVNLILAELCKLIEQYYLQFRSKNTELINNLYLKNLYRLNEWHWYRINNLVKEGKIIGTDIYGKLEIIIDDKTQVYDFKEIEFLLK